MTNKFCWSRLAIPFYSIIIPFQLQEAFAAGLLKPGLNTVVEKSERKLTNNVAGLKQKTEELAAPLKKLPWIEKLDHVVLKLAPLAPELALKVKEQ